MIDNHKHCPDGCSHPQPITDSKGKQYCGRCWFKYGEVVEMVDCNEAICGTGSGATGTGSNTTGTGHDTTRADSDTETRIQRRRGGNNNPTGGYSGNHRICGAKTQSGGVCQKHPMEGKTRCHKHGGRSLGGIANPNFKDGKYSKYVPRGLKKAYEQAISDQELLSLRDDIALLESRQVELLSVISNAQEGAPQWVNVSRAVDQLCSALSSGNVKSRTEALSHLVEIVRDGIKADYVVQKAWEELRTTLTDKVKATTAEAKRLSDMDQNLTKQQALSLMAVVVSAVRDNVADKEVLGRIQSRLNQVLLEDKSESDE